MKQHNSNHNHIEIDRRSNYSIITKQKSQYQYTPKRCTTKTLILRVCIVAVTVVATITIHSTFVHAKQPLSSKNRATKVPSTIISRTPITKKRLPVVAFTKTKAVIKTKSTDSHHHQHHEEELMSGPTAIANVLADLCPHGMLPIGMCILTLSF